MSKVITNELAAQSGDTITLGNVVGVAATFTGNVSVGGTLTYEDVTNVDSIGIITARSGIKVGSAVTINDTGLNVVGVITATSFDNDSNTRISFPATDTFAINTAGSERLRIKSDGKVGLGTNNPGHNLEIMGSFPDFAIEDSDTPNDKFRILHNGGGTQLMVDPNNVGPNASYFLVSVDGSEKLRVTSAGKVGLGTNNPQEQFVVSNSGAEGVEITAGATSNLNKVVHYSRSASAYTSARVDAAEHIFRIGSTERFRITSRGGFNFSNGLMNETCNINTTARTGTQAVNLDEGMVHYFSTNSTGTWKPNFTMSSGDDINATLATGDVFSPTLIVAKGATTHFANAIQVDGTDVTPEFSGGAPTDGGGSGTFDIYTYTIIKTGDDAFKAFAAVSNYE